MDPSQPQQKPHSILHIQASEGPIPSPEILAGYEHLMPGLADRISAMAEKESAHRRELEKKILNAQISDANEERIIEKRGQIFGFCIGITALVFGFLTAYIGHPVAGAFIGAGGVISLVSVFSYNKK